MPDRENWPLLTALEEGDLGAADALRLFGSLVRTGLAWSLPGWYGRTALRLIEEGWLDSAGEPNPVLASTLCEVPRCPQRTRHRHAPAGPSRHLPARSGE